MLIHPLPAVMTIESTNDRRNRIFFIKTDSSYNRFHGIKFNKVSALNSFQKTRD
jgi:hypothetical protein